MMAFASRIRDPMTAPDPAVFDQMTPSRAAAPKKVLNTGSGPASPQNLHPAFLSCDWTQTRLDLNPEVQPDVIGSILDMRAVVSDDSFDAIWCSHNLEHLHAHEVVPALREFVRVLKSDGFALVSSPDLEFISQLVIERGLDTTIYNSPAGPITPLDMIYGHIRSVAAGNRFMCHNCGFTTKTLGVVALQAGFAEARVAAMDDYALWGLLLMPQTNIDVLRKTLASTKQAFLVND